MSNDTLEGIAIIGMAGRFPGAKNIDEFWSNLCAGRQCITAFSDETLDPSLPRDLVNHPDYVKARGIIDDVDRFDAAFFGINTREAEIMDPQHRIFLELAWHALEHAGYNPDNFKGLIGVFAGMGNNTYFTSNVINHPEKIEAFTPFQAMLANEKDFLATRVSFKLNLTGPSLSIYTACSTSLVTVCQACDSLLAYQCDMALAGGISIFTPQNSGYLYQEGMIASKDGICRPFDADANGTIFGNGGGIVVLKRLEDALEDNDNIIAVIRGTATNNDGADKVSFSAPSVKGQAEVIMMAIANAGVSPNSISYVEAHGTGTPLGDPIEIAALTKAFGDECSKRTYCAIGSAKGNVGHLDSAAGVAGLIKTALALNKGELPPSINYQKPNPEIDFKNSPFIVNTRLSPWKPQGYPRRAGISSFGIGGTNAHAILEAPPKKDKKAVASNAQLIILSARTPEALEAQRKNMAAFLSEHPDLELADVAYTLQTGRKNFANRGMLVSKDLNDATEALQSDDSARLKINQAPKKSPEVVFMFPGQGAQYINMGSSLYEAETTFRNTVDHCAQLLLPIIDENLTDIMFPGNHNPERVAEKLRQTRYNQPALFVIEYALAKLWESWGVLPSAMIGHSIGEYTAACIAGVFSVEDALLLVSERGRLMQAQPQGAMIAVSAPADTVASLLPDSLSVAAVNAPSFCVVSGQHDEIETFGILLDDKEVAWRHLKTSHAFHSQMMEPVVKPFEKIVASIRLNAPEKPYVSTLTGSWIEPQQAKDPSYWAKHLRKPVLFSSGIETLMENPKRIYLEIGPGQTAATLAAQHSGKQGKIVSFSSLGRPLDKDNEWALVIESLGRIWLLGVDIDWAHFHKNRGGSKVPLPLYPFERKRYWLDTKAEPACHSAQAISETKSSEPSDESLGKQIEIAAKAHGAISLCATIKTGDNTYAVFYTSHPSSSITTTDVRIYLQKHFGHNVLIRQVFELTDFPMDDHGNIDRPRLSSRLNPNPRQKHLQVDLKNESERLLADIWKETLNIEFVEPTDNFYELGGNSLLSVQIISQVKQKTGIELKPESILLDTLRQISAHHLEQSHNSNCPTKKPAGTNAHEIQCENQKHDTHIELFYFGKSNSPLMGAYYPVPAQEDKNHSVLLCYPIGHEYMRSHWAFRQLSNLLSKAGFNVLRFDYFATGDSAGNSCQGDVDQWIKDIHIAANELQTISGANTISAVGLRFGASLAYLASTEGISFNNLILWDPVVDGKAYLDEIKTMHLDTFSSHRNKLRGNSLKEILGFPYPMAMQNKIEHINLVEMNNLNSKHISVMATAQTKHYLDLVETLKSNRKKVEAKTIHDAGDWNDIKKYDQALVVNKMLDEILCKLS